MGPNPNGPLSTVSCLLELFYTQVYLSVKVGPVGDFLEYYTPGKLTNIAVAGKWGPLWILLKMGIFQPAMLVKPRG